MVGQVVSGSHGEVLVRQKTGETLELGEILVCDSNGRKLLFQVFDLKYGSQVEEKAIEMASGMSLQGFSEQHFLDDDLRNYVLASLKPLAEIIGSDVVTVKALPKFFSSLRRLEAKDLSFLTKPEHALFVGNVRCGSRSLDLPVYLNGREVLPHHVFIPATTGRGKSNLVKVMLYSLLPESYCGILVLDPHNEYYSALSKHSKKEKLVYYSTKPSAGGFSLRINYSSLRPWHFQGVMPFSDPQQEAMHALYNAFKDQWVSKILSDEVDFKKFGINELTYPVLQRRLKLVLNESVFVENGGEALVDDVVSDLFSGKKVIIDTSRLSGESELLVGGLLASSVFSKAKSDDSPNRPVVSIVIEEAPRVLSEKNGSSVFSSIAREGRKFGVGLIAITQLASLIPREVLANLNTKIILGNEMAQEREAIISSAAQDLSSDSKTIASLGKGEALLSSVFSKFAVPLIIPKFEDFSKSDSSNSKKVFV
ncbi:ATP-binding protein [Candidatus Micrarchaeota archaeon]|nr:ATP-binding protein [Candidatus Micrarchaeota archaeon]